MGRLAAEGPGGVTRDPKFIRRKAQNQEKALLPSASICETAGKKPPGPGTG